MRPDLHRWAKQEYIYTFHTDNANSLIWPIPNNRIINETLLTLNTLLLPNTKNTENINLSSHVNSFGLVDCEDWAEKFSDSIHRFHGAKS